MHGSQPHRSVETPCGLRVVPHDRSKDLKLCNLSLDSHGWIYETISASVRQNYCFRPGTIFESHYTLLDTNISFQGIISGLNPVAYNASDPAPLWIIQVGESSAFICIVLMSHSTGSNHHGHESGSIPHSVMHPSTKGYRRGYCRCHSRSKRYGSHPWIHQCHFSTIRDACP